MQRLASRFLAAASVGLGLFSLASAAQARSDVYFSVGVGGAPAYMEPAPVYVQPAPVYVEPSPTYAWRRDIYGEPAPVYVRPSRMYVQPAYSVNEEREWRREEWRRRQWRHHYWRQQHGWED